MMKFYLAMACALTLLTGCNEKETTTAPEAAPMEAAASAAAPMAEATSAAVAMAETASAAVASMEEAASAAVATPAK